ncbi:hypothetical protein DEU56DRAFT_756468 [Suillus clintonianus]|uniref:uncharacterized protein n=1 Tax=Suillus clintonianus TaxID=1904413 RepID=UPI001B876CAC|nr:uncharacterized protein DEU56DRAFT_756468 [Suillus clintonianus]KAG2135773.1 hypothetical protein DEU56DRAFT_756468 [Suillus clintonianus]
MCVKYKSAEERREAQLKSKKESYARRRLQEQAKSRTRWRHRKGAAVDTQDLLQRLDSLWISLGYCTGCRSSTIQCEFLELYGMSIVIRVDREGWDSVKPGCEEGLAEITDLLQRAFQL